MINSYQSKKKQVTPRTLLDNFIKRVEENTVDRFLSEVLPTIWTCNNDAFNNFVKDMLDIREEYLAFISIKNSAGDMTAPDFDVLLYFRMKGLISYVEHMDDFEEFSKIADINKVEYYKDRYFPQIVANDHLVTSKGFK